MSSSSRKCSITNSPIASDDTSFSPWLSSSRTILETSCSMRSGSTARLRSAICTERISLSRSNGTRRLLRLMTVSSRSCTRSKVVKRKLQVRHTRRRRITAESSVGRESFTCVSRLPQLGQRMMCPPTPLLSCPALCRASRLGTQCPSDRDGRDKPGHDTECAAPPSLINREALEQRADLVAHLALDQRVLFRMLLRQHVEHLGDHVADLLEFGDAEAARRTRRRAEADARGDG